MAVEDNQALVSALAASHGGQLRRFLLARVRNICDVPDLIQEVYLRVLRVPHVESIRSPEAYLFTVAQHVAEQHMLRQSATPPCVDLTRMLDPPHASPDADPVLGVDAQQCLEKLQGTLDELAPKVRATFILHRRDGLSFDEIGVRLRVSRPMVKKYMTKALLRFRLRLETME